MFSYLRQPRGFYRRLFLLALPIIVQNLITTSLGFLDKIGRASRRERV